MSAPAFPPARDTERRLAALIAIAAASLLIAGWLAPLTPDSAASLAPAAFLAEAQTHLLPALEPSSASTTATHPFALAHYWSAGIVALTGQWDARLLAIGSLVFAVGGVTTLLLALGRLLSPQRLALLALAALSLALLAARESPGTGAHALVQAWFWLTLLQLVLTAREKSAGSCALGWIAGALNIAASSLGTASALATLARDLRAGAPRGRIVASAVLAAFGLGWLVIRLTGSSNLATGSDVSLPSSVPAVLVWAPALLALWRWRRTPEPGLHFTAPLVLAFGGATLVFTLAGAEPPRAWALLVVLANVAALASLRWSADAGQRTRDFCLAAAWLLVVANVLAQPHTRPEPGRYEPVAESADEHARPAAEAFAAQPEIRAVLPSPLREPLALHEENGGSSFGTATPPELPSPDGLPVVSSWNATDGASTHGEFRSALLVTRASILQVRVAGSLRPPDTELLLVTASGRAIPPLETGFSVGNRWKRVNFSAPGEPFRVVARDHSGADWLAFTAPLEVSQLSFVATKVARAWRWWLLPGVLCAAVVARRLRMHWRTVLGVNEWRAVPWLALFGYACFFLPHIDHTAGPNDAGGYLNFAKTVSTGAIAHEIRRPDFDLPAAKQADLYLPTTARVAPDGAMAPEYPPGMGLMIGAAAWVLPLAHATVLVMALHLLGAVVITWRAARVFGLSEAWAWLAAGILGLSSVFLFQTLQPQSDGASVLWVTAAVAFAWSSREHAWHVFVAGVATAIAVLVRPANALCALPVLACLWGRPRALRNLILVGAPAAVWLLWFNFRQYGHPLRTGYGDVSDAWSASFIGPTLASYAQWLPAMFTPVVVAAFAAPWFGSFAPRARVVLGLWAASFFVFYALYWCTYDNWYNMRFVLPAMPALLVLGLHVTRAALARSRLAFFPSGPQPAALWPSALLVVALLGLAIVDTVRRDVLPWVHAARAHRVAVEWLNERAPANSIVIARHASNAVWHYTNFQLVRPDRDAVRAPGFLTELATTGRPIFAINQHWEQRGFEWGHGKGEGRPDLPGEWERLAVLWEGEYVIWRWHPPKPDTAR